MSRPAKWEHPTDGWNQNRRTERQARPAGRLHKEIQQEEDEVPLAIELGQHDFEKLVTHLGSAEIDIINRWLERGDGVAVYENHDLGHPDIGHKQFVSYGSPSAQLEVDYPPERLPDIGGRIGWRYILVATYRGPQL